MMIGQSNAFAPSIADDLEITIAPGQMVIAGTVVRVPLTVVFVEPNVASFIYISPNAGTVGINNSAYPVNEWPVCRLTTDGQKVLVLIDDRPDFSFLGNVMTFNFADSETPIGAINGINRTFLLQNAPSPPASLRLVQNGLVLTPGIDYTLADQFITFQTAPATGDTLVAWYRY